MKSAAFGVVLDVRTTQGRGRRKTVSELTTAVESVGGSVIALDVTASGPLTALHRRHYPRPRHRHADQLIEAMRSVTGVVISKVSRTEPEAWIRYVVALR